MSPPPLPSKDREHLRSLVICHYVCAGFGLAGMAFLVLHYSIMNAVFSNPKLWEKAKEPPPFDPALIVTGMQWFYLIMGVMILASAVLTLLAGLSIRARVRRTFSMVVAGLNCMQFPIGTLLGVFTLIVLSRDSVVRLYEIQQADTSRLPNE
ncbi:hypothetical protein EI77_01028 [Prosthecobacter fusiformis]|uniref:Uncharacterized protein n=1 Tax=Prosthecobacter fusiformis TaxID=48464 RepID=A0A4R7STX4_9BACT|nr:hypothetical protein [Prosthecobacter fusiformis]TDU81718.1 hypothetical protein EI77_01028 [Prosthecobacter fusiformis]